MPDDPHDYALRLPFDTDDPEFVRGVECGRIWTLVNEAADTDVIREMVHTKNAEMMLRIAEACERPLAIEEHDETWMTVEFGPVGATA